MKTQKKQTIICLSLLLSLLSWSKNVIGRLRHIWAISSSYTGFREQFFYSSVKIMLTKVPRDIDVINTALSSGVIMRVVWGQHSSLWTCEVTSAGSCGDRKWSNREAQLTNVKQPAYNTWGNKAIKYNQQINFNQHKCRGKQFTKWDKSTSAADKYHFGQHTIIIWHLRVTLGTFSKGRWAVNKQKRESKLCLHC